ncbi:MAG: hypothetical protein M3N21_05665 [Actinomycetota bacterium]|nr:hypothetical protein [Actinomycetota bacterium]
MTTIVQTFTCPAGCGKTTNNAPSMAGHVAAKHPPGDVPDRPALLPVEKIALTVALAQVLRGDGPTPNVAATCVLALARIDGRHDWTAEVAS